MTVAIDVDKQLLTKADCRRLGLSRPDVDRMFERCTTITLPGSQKTYIRTETMEEWLEIHAAAPPPSREGASVA